jgi:hypothetical protein
MLKNGRMPIRVVGYGLDPEQEKRYSPAQCIGAKKKIMIGRPVDKHISTSARSGSSHDRVRDRDHVLPDVHEPRRMNAQPPGLAA